MSSRINRLICAALAVLLVLCGALAEEGGTEPAAPPAAETSGGADPLPSPGDAGSSAQGDNVSPEPENTGSAGSGEGATAGGNETGSSEPEESGFAEPGDTGSSESGESGSPQSGADISSEPGEGDSIEPGEGSTTEPSENGSSESGESGTTEPGEGGTTEPDEGGSDEPGEGGSTEPGENGTTEPGEGGSTGSGESGSSSGGPGPESGDDPLPEPEYPEITIAVKELQGVTERDGVYQTADKQPASIVFAWACPYDFEQFAICVFDEKNEPVLTPDPVVTETETETGTGYEFTLSLDGLQSGNYRFVVDATAGEEIVARGEFALTLSSKGRRPDQGFPGGGFPRGGGEWRSSASMRGGSMAGGAQGQQGFRVTPGEALSGSHSSGTKDMRLYGVLDLTVSGAPMTELVVGGESLDVTLDGGASAFTAAIEGDRLALVAEASGEVWTLNGLVLKRLAQSGIETLVLEFDGSEVELSASEPLQGEVYGALHSEGYASSEFIYAISREGIRVSVDGRQYLLDQSNGLIPMEDD